MAKAPYYSDDKVDDIHWEVQKRLEKQKKDPIRNIPTSALIFLVLAAIIAIFIAISRDISLTKVIFMVALFAAIAFLLNKRGDQTDILSEQECKNELYYKLKFKQRNPLGGQREIPDGEIKIDIKTRLRWYEGRPWKRYTGFTIVTPDGLPEEYYAVQDPYTGDIIEANPVPEGWNPDNVKDIVMIAAPDLMRERRYTEYGGTLRR